MYIYLCVCVCVSYNKKINKIYKHTHIHTYIHRYTYIHKYIHICIVCTLQIRSRSAYNSFALRLILHSNYQFRSMLLC